MAMMLGGLTGLLGGGAAAGTAAATTATVGSGFSIGSLLQGLATVMGVVSTIQAGQAESDKLDMMANDAEAEKPFETLQSVDRKRSLLAAAAEATGAGDVAYAGSGVDLSFGSAAQARKDAYRELDLGLTTDSATTATRLSRLEERAYNYRAMAKRTKMASFFSAFTSAVPQLASLGSQY